MLDNVQRSRALLMSGELELSLVDAEALASDVLSGPAVDTRDRFHNRFFHEFLPLVTIARVVGRAVASQISFTAIDHGFDGRFTSDHGNIRLVEMTAAIDGRAEALRMEMLARYGEAPAFGIVRAYGNKHNRIFDEIQSCGGRADKHDYEYILPLMQERLKAKVANATKREAYKGAWLGIVFDDNAAIEKKRRNRFDALCKRLLSEANTVAPFGRILCVGITGTYVFDGETLTGSLLPLLGRY
jgi:hypothetical protein